MPSTAGPAELLSDLAAALDALGAGWYVFGAQAALVWGRPRLATDLNVTVKSSGSTERLVGTLDTHGFALRIDATATFIRTTRVVPLEHRASGLALDVVLAGPGSVHPTAPVRPATRTNRPLLRMLVSPSGGAMQ